MFFFTNEITKYCMYLKLKKEEAAACITSTNRFLTLRLGSNLYVERTVTLINVVIVCGFALQPRIGVYLINYTKIYCPVVIVPLCYKN